MRQVSRQVFNNFLKVKKTKTVRGDYIHSEYWVDEDNNKIAYMETSSWGAPDVYMIEDDLADNFETTNLITNILNSK